MPAARAAAYGANLSSATTIERGKARASVTSASRIESRNPCTSQSRNSPDRTMERSNDAIQPCRFRATGAPAGMASGRQLVRFDAEVPLLVLEARLRSVPLHEEAL